MKNLPFAILILACIATHSAFGFEAEVIAKVGRVSFTNVDIYEQTTRSPIVPAKYLGPEAMKGLVDRMIDPYMYEQYLLKNDISVSDDEIIEDYKRMAADNGKSFEEYIEEIKTINDEGCEDFRTWQRFEEHRQRLKPRKAILHFDPSVLNVTDEDIQEFLKSNSGDYMTPKLGEKGSVTARSISDGRKLQIFDRVKKGEKYEDVIKDYNLKDEATLKEFEKIRDRINNGENFEEVANDYKENNNFRIQSKPEKIALTTLSGYIVNVLGVETPVYWGAFKGKAVLVDMGDFGYSLMIIDEFTPTTRVSVEEALADKDCRFRKEALQKVESWKFFNARRNFCQMADDEFVVYSQDKEKVYQKLADEYELWYAEAFKDSPNIERQLDKIRFSKIEYLERRQK